MAQKRFPNGFDSWQETHFEISVAIGKDLLRDEFKSKVIKDRHEAQGTGGMYELAEELTEKFEKANKGRIWDGEFFEIIDKFIEEELYS